MESLKYSSTLSGHQIHSFLLESFHCFTRSALPENSLKSYVPAVPDGGRTFVIGAGKAAGAMAQEFEKLYTGPPDMLGGVVVTRYGHTQPTETIKVMEAAHPVPDAAAGLAVEAILSLLEQAGKNDLVICLLSGGGSALLSAPVEGVAFEELQTLSKALLRCGASIGEINIVRKHLNIVLGGGLAKAAHPARLVTLAISDVTGDDKAVIASGPTVGDPSSLEDARNVLERYSIEVPDSIQKALKDLENETPKPDDTLFERADYHLIAAPAQGLESAAHFWKDKGFTPYIYGAEIEGDTNAAAKDHVDFIRGVMNGKIAGLSPPCAVLSGGETTVKVQSDSGQGGPNTQFMLSAALELKGLPSVYAMACDSDGIDGIGDQAGAFITPDILEKADAAKLKAESFMKASDSRSFFAALDHLVITGPTYTNINDYRVFLLLPS